MLEWIIAGAFLAGAGWLAVRRHFETLESRSWRLEREWEARCRAAGMTSDEIWEERQMRTQFAMLQQKCSLHVLTAPDPAATWEAVLKREIESAAGFLAGLDPAMSKRFIKWISGLRESDILTPDAFDRLHPMPAIARLSDAERQRLALIRQAAFTDRT